jgi:hypothetical protein
MPESRGWSPGGFARLALDLRCFFLFPTITLVAGKDAVRIRAATPLYLYRLRCRV